MKKLKIQILLLLLLSATLCLAQDWVNLITPQKIHEIFEIDNKLYCATEGGLVIYDQSTQTIERNLVADDVPSHRVEDITQDATGNIWIGTYDNGLARMTSNGWEHLPIDQTVNDELKTYCIEFDNNGVLWAGTFDGLFKYENNTWTQETHDPIWDMEQDEQGVIHTAGWGAGELENSAHTEEYFNYFSLVGSHIDYSPDGTLYWASDIGDVKVFDGTIWTTYTRDDIGLSNLIYGRTIPTDIIYTSSGEVWVAFRENGIYKFDGNNWEEIYVVDNSTAHIKFIETTSSDFIISIDDKLYEYNNGFYELADLSIEFNRNDVKIAKNENNEMLVLSDGQVIKYDAQLNPAVLPMLPEVDDDSVLDFITHLDGSIGFINIDNGDTYYNGQVQQNIPDNAIIGTINDYIIDSYGNYWLVAYGGIIRNNQGAITVYDETNMPFLDENYPEFHAVTEDRNGDIWISSDEIVARWERSTQTWVEFHDVPIIWGDSYPTCLYVDEDNALWAGSDELFVSPAIIPTLTRLEGDTWVSYSTQNSNLESSIISDITQINGQLVLATRAGMSIFDGTDFVNFNRDNSSIGSAYCNKIEQDGQGNIWIASVIEGITGHGGISIYNSNGIALNNQETPPNSPLPIHLFPNPTKTFFQIDSKLIQEIPVQIQIFDLNGRLVKTVSNSSIVHTDDIPPGMYAVLVRTDEQQYASKVLIANK